VDENALRHNLNKAVDIELNQDTQDQPPQANEEPRSAIQDNLQDRINGQESELLQQMLK
jgi:hypothetical protein